MLSANHIKGLLATIVITISFTSFIACNSTASDYGDSELSASTMVTSFSLTDDSNVLANLDSIFFTIDLQQSLIYNADSLPYGTNISRLIPIITTADGASVAELTFRRPQLPDSVVDYLTNSTDSIDFSQGPVSLRLVAPNGTASQTYLIKVLVHQQKPDSLVWSRLQRTNLPSTFAVPTAQATHTCGNKLFCLTSSSGKYCMAATTNPGNNDWQKKEITLPFEPQIQSFRGTTRNLYLLDTTGNLYQSADEGESWTATGQNFHYLYGQYNGELIASRHTSTGWQIVFFPSGTSFDMPQGFPIEGSSLPVEYTFNMASTPQTVIVGGRTADGTLTGDTWGFDGSSWAQLSLIPMPVPLENLAVVPYFTFKVNSLYQPTKYSALIAFGGRNQVGALNRTVYISLDFGMNWKEADQLLQLPDYLPAMASSQAFVFDDTLSRASAAGWQSFACPAIPSSWTVLPYYSYDLSRIDKPVTEWECPYIYLFGGTSADGTLYNTVWRGVINRFTFTPIP